MDYRPFQEEEPEVPGSQQIGAQNNLIGSGGGKVRLRAVETEAQFFLKFLNVTILRWLILVQIVSSVLIVLFQVCHIIYTEYQTLKSTCHI